MAGEELGFIPDIFLLHGKTSNDEIVPLSVDSEGKVILAGGLTLKGGWDANTNTPTLSNGGGGGSTGDFYVVTVSGSTTIDGISSWVVGDWIVNNGTVWFKADHTDAVASVFGRTGIVTAQANDYTWAQIDKTTSSVADVATKDHDLLDGLSDDDHSQYALLAGRSGGQTLIGDVDASGNLTLQSTAHATKGTISCLSPIGVNPATDQGVVQTWYSADRTKSLAVNAPANASGSAPFIFNTANSYDFQTDSFSALKIEAGGNVIINDVGHSGRDLRVKGDNDDSLFFTDASEDKVGIGTATPEEKLHVAGNVLLTNNQAVQMDDSGGVAREVLKMNTASVLILGSTSQGDIHLRAAGGQTIYMNSQGADVDFVVEGDNDANLLFCDAGNDRVGIGTATPGTKFEVADTSNPTVRVTEGGSATTHLELADTDGIATIQKTVATGNATLDLGAICSDGSSIANVRCFRNTNTSGNVGLNILLGNNSTTINTKLAGNNSQASYICGDNGDVAIGRKTTSAKLHVDQAATDGAKPVILLDQADVSEEFMRFVGTAASATLTNSIVDDDDVTTATLQAWLKIYVQDDGNQISDQAYFIPIYTLA